MQRQLVERAIAGDHDAFSDLVRTAYPRLHQIGPQVAKFSPTGELLATYGAEGPGAFIGYAGPLTVDAQGRVYVTTIPAHPSSPGILVFEADGTYIGGFGPDGSDDGQLLGASGILLDGEGNAYVFDAGDFEHENFETGSVEMFRLLPPLVP